MEVEIFLGVFLPSVLKKLPCFHGMGRGWNVCESFIPTRAGNINQHAAEGKQNPEMFSLVWVPSFHAVPGCSALPELGRSREYREEPGATKDPSEWSSWAGTHLEPLGPALSSERCHCRIQM